MTYTHPPPSPSPEFINSCELPEPRMNITNLCNPNNEDDNLRRHHTSELFSDELEDIQKRTLAEECDSKWMLITLMT